MPPPLEPRPLRIVNPSIAPKKQPGWAVKGERWAEFRDRHGDWGRDLVLYLGRKRCGLKLGALSELAGGVDDATVGMAVKRFADRVRTTSEWQTRLREIENQMLNVGT